MLAASIYPLLALLAGTARAQSTTTATVLIPDWCVTQAQPTVTVLGQGDMTTYSYSCSIDSSAVSSASAHASDVAASARSKASEMKSKWDPRVTGKPNDHNKRTLDFFGKRDDTCYGWNAFEACIPWEITQGPSIWAVHFTNNIVALDQECTFGQGGIASGPATCTASGRLDPELWGRGDGPHTHTFVKSDVDRYWIRNAVSVTMGGIAQATTAKVSGSGSAQAASGSPGVQSTGVGVPLSIPTGAVAMVVGAGGILAAALAL